MIEMIKAMWLAFQQGIGSRSKCCGAKVVEGENWPSIQICAECGRKVSKS